MWVLRKEWNALEKRVADLEERQLEAATMVKDYIEDSESAANQLEKLVKELPQTIADNLKELQY